MEDDLFGERRRALEEEFFRKHNEALLGRMREEREHEHARAALGEVSGLTDPAVLEELLGLGLTAASLTALSLVPLVAVAWADGRLESQERDALLRAAADAGITEGSAARILLESWLVVEPEPGLLDVWIEYTRELRPLLSAVARDAIHEETMARARRIAEAAGGYLGLGAHTSAEERAILERVDAALA